MENPHHRREFVAGSLAGPVIFFLFLSDEGRTWMKPEYWWPLFLGFTALYLWCVWHMIASFGNGFRAGFKPFLKWLASPDRLFYFGIVLGGILIMVAGSGATSAQTRIGAASWAAIGGLGFATILYLTTS